MLGLRCSRWMHAVALAVLGLFLSPPLAQADSWDWRNVNGKNYMTPAKAQGPMECRTFAGLAAIEAKIKIVLDDPNLDIDLSERHVLQSTHGRSGFPQFSGTGVATGTGILTEAELPYDMDPVVFAPDWEDRAYSISEFKVAVVKLEIEQRDTIKQWLRNYGPLYVQHNHAVTLVGYDDDLGKWIVKETCGPSCGDNGYFYKNWDYMQSARVEMLTGNVYYGGELIPEPGSAVVLLLSLPWVLRVRGRAR